MNHQNNGREKGRAPRRLRRRKQRRAIALLVSLLLVFGAAAGVTIAFLTTQTEEKKNTFVPAEVSCEVKETFNGTVKTDVAIKNTGNAESYIRASVCVTWMKNEDASDQTVSARVPQKGIDYEISYFEKNGWIEGGDGYWYYQAPLAPGEETKELIKSLTQLEGATVPENCHLSVEILASAIQSSPSKAAGMEWNAEVEDGKIVGIKESGVTGK